MVRLMSIPRDGNPMYSPLLASLRNARMISGAVASRSCSSAL